MGKTDIKSAQNDFKEADMEKINALLKQLKKSSPELAWSDVCKVMDSGGMIFSLRDASRGNALIGMGTLIPVRKLFSFCGSVEDVVVDEGYRGQGLGRKIMKEIIKEARDLEMKFLDLTSGFHRQAANKLYQSLGFELRETNPYRLYL